MAITQDRWQAAQAVEAENWARTGLDEYRFIHELAEHSDVAPRLRALLRGKEHLNALEVGVGPLGIGFLAVHLKASLCHITGIEPLPILEAGFRDQALAAYAKKLQSRVSVVRGKGENLPFPDEAFDLTCCINVLDHSHVPDAILEQIRRVTKRCGLCVLGVNTLSFLGRIKWHFLRMANPHLPGFVMHPYVYGWGTLRKTLVEGGWEVMWANRPSAAKRLAGHAQMSFWILQRR